MILLAAAAGKDEGLDNLNDLDDSNKDVDTYPSDDGDKNDSYIMPPKRQLTKQPSAAKIAEQDGNDKPPFAHPMQTCSR